jgi:hypothetical protein
MDLIDAGRAVPENGGRGMRAVFIPFLSFSAFAVGVDSLFESVQSLEVCMPIDKVKQDAATRKYILFSSN